MKRLVDTTNKIYRCQWVSSFVIPSISNLFEAASIRFLINGYSIWKILHKMCVRSNQDSFITCYLWQTWWELSREAKEKTSNVYNSVKITTLVDWLIGSLLALLRLFLQGQAPNLYRTAPSLAALGKVACIAALGNFFMSTPLALVNPHLKIIKIYKFAIYFCDRVCNSTF